MSITKDSKIYVAGGRGLLGTAIVEQLQLAGYRNIVTKTSQELDLTNQSNTYQFLQEEKPDAVILSAAKVGGIMANKKNPAEFISTNSMIAQNVIWGSYLAGVKNLLFVNSSCVYPKNTKQPIHESQLLTSPLEETNKAFAVAKIMGSCLVESIRAQYGLNYFTCMFCNLYGKNDNFDPNNSHVLPALIKKFHEALPNKPVMLWGSGKPKREFLYVSDAAEAIVHLLNNNKEHAYVNVGTGTSVSIKELAEKIQEVLGHKGTLLWDTSMPDGHPEKRLDTTLVNSLGWDAKTSLEEGILLTYRYYLEEISHKVVVEHVSAS